MRGGDRSGLGLWGEEQAARHLESQGYQVTASRYRCREGELDLVAEGKGYLCFVEVKLRKDHHLAQAREFVTPAKQPEGAHCRPVLPAGPPHPAAAPL